MRQNFCLFFSHIFPTTVVQWHFTDFAYIWTFSTFSMIYLAKYYLKTYFFTFFRKNNLHSAYLTAYSIFNTRRRDLMHMHSWIYFPYFQLSKAKISFEILRATTITLETGTLKLIVVYLQVMSILFIRKFLHSILIICVNANSTRCV